MGGPTEYIIWTTQLKPLFKSGQRLWVRVYLDHHVQSYMFLKKTILPRRNKHYFEMYLSKSSVYSWGFIRDPIIGGFTTIPCRHLKSGPIVHLRKIPRSAGQKNRFSLQLYIHQNAWFQVWISEIFLGRWLGPPPQTPAQSQGSLSILGRFASSVRAAPSIHPSNMFNNPSPNRGVLDQSFPQTPTFWLHHWTQYIVLRLRS